MSQDQYQQHQNEGQGGQPPYPPQYGQPPQFYPQQGAVPRKKHWVRNTLLGIVIGFFALIVIGVAAGSGSSGSGSTAAGTAPAVTPSAGASPSAAPASTGPSMTTGEQQAVDGARGYLAMGSGFSYKSLLNQLTSSVGDGDTTADAKFAIDYLHPDWDAQAVDAAKGYLQMGGFSRSSMINQLTSSAGDGFTESQAEYAATKVGL